MLDSQNSLNATNWVVKQTLRELDGTIRLWDLTAGTPRTDLLPAHQPSGPFDGGVWQLVVATQWNPLVVLAVSTLLGTGAWVLGWA